jgi:hypothetical protein
MSTVGTLYDEAIKFGTAKLLTVASATDVANMSFLMNNPDFDTYIFEMVTQFPAAGIYLYSRWSGDGGASWLATQSYVWTTAIMNVHGGAPNVIYYSSTQLGTVYLEFGRIGWASLAAGYPMSGRLIFYRSPGAGGVKYMEWMMSNYSNLSYGWISATGNCYNVSMAGPNAILFYPHTGLMSGTIRMYGLRKGG